MSKPMGAIPAGYGADAENMLLIGGRRADALVAEAGGTPLFVYDLGLVDARIARFRAAFAGVDLHYAIKANSYIPLLRHIDKQVDGLDIASGIVHEAVAIGYPDDRLGEGIALVVRPDRRDRDSELRAFLKRQLPNFMQPGVIVWRDELPRSPNGKLDRVELRQELVA